MPSLAKMLLTTHLTVGFASGAYWYQPTSYLHPRSSWASWAESLDQHFDTLNDMVNTLAHASPRSGTWARSEDTYSTRIRINGIEPQSLTASLSQDGKSLNLSGKREVEGCTCSESSIGAVDLPFTPRKAEDVGLTYKEGILEVALPRHTARGQERSLPITVKTDQVKANDVPLASTSENPDERREIRFIPHESASSDAKLEATEKSLLAKFRSVATIVGAHAPAVSDTNITSQQDGQPRAKPPDEASAASPAPTADAIKAE